MTDNGFQVRREQQCTGHQESCGNHPNRHESDDDMEMRDRPSTNLMAGMG